MIGYCCARCTRIFEAQDRPANDRLPRHLDMLIGLPCRGTGETVWYYA